MKLGLVRGTIAVLLCLVSMAGILYSIWSMYANLRFSAHPPREATVDDYVIIEGLEKQTLEALDKDKASPELNDSRLRALGAGDEINKAICRIYLVKTVERKLSTSQSEQLRLDQELDNLVLLAVRPRGVELFGIVMMTVLAIVILMAVMFAE